MANCLTTTGRTKLKELFKKYGTIGLRDMSSKQRIELFRKELGEGVAEWVNLEVETAFTRVKNEALKNYVNKTVADPKKRKDITDRVEKFEKVFARDIASGKAKEIDRKRFLESVVAQKLGVTVSPSEAAKIVDLSKAIRDAKKTYSDNKKVGKATEKDRLALGHASNMFKEYLTEIKGEEGRLKIDKFFRSFKDKATRDEVKNAFFKHPAGTLMKRGNEFLNNIPRFSIASGDIGAPLRQSLVALAHGKKEASVWAKNYVEMLSNSAKALKGEDFKDLVMADIYSRENYLNGEYERSGLAIGTLEDYFGSTIIEHFIDQDTKNIFINGLQRYTAFSQDVYLAYLYKMRADLYDAVGHDLFESGENAKSVGELINQMTGRGNLEKVGGEGITPLFFSAKLIKSRIDFLTANIGNDRMSMKMKAKSLKALVTYASFVFILGALLKAMGGEIEDDPRSKNFGKIRITENLWLDLTLGLGGFVATGVQVSTGEMKTNKGKIKDLDEKKYGSMSRDQVLIKFFVNKMAPIFGITDRAITGKDWKGDDISVLDQILEIIPIPAQAIVDGAKEEKDPIEIAISFILGEIGFTVSEKPTSK